MSAQNKNTQGFIPSHGGYRNLFSNQKAEIIDDGTVYFTKRFFLKYNRTVGQMVQAARCGKQYIAEAGMASESTYKPMYLKLMDLLVDRLIG